MSKHRPYAGFNSASSRVRTAPVPTTPELPWPQIFCQLCRDGRSRCFGFVGFKDKQQAADARQYFDKSCMGSCRLEVSFAESYKAENSPHQAAAGREQHDANTEQDNAKISSSKVCSAYM